MTSRLTAIATVFAIFAAASLTYAASVQQIAFTAPITAATATANATVKPVRIVQLERVVVVGKRLPQQAL